MNNQQKPEPLYYERLLKIRKLSHDESLIEEKDGTIVECVREMLDTHNWGDLDEINFSMNFTRGPSGFKVGDKVRIVIERVD